ncbi:dihydroorotase [Evansella cellulosilytica]|uniref:Dihydroorotase n=1 Tax=Evansella cellulosilytica (strain ATCC 21833 / DSM 2522 / FERM P-1141 / JCM 9156 / N-4) TaxID=649639 RepID=E6TTQ7_EVAC2|nr:dihydroorotase [Evansella cellulosilytica]ADU30826.1 dihydroorotase, multifunctional complex type [Evansella cellulosilytica DSM 2522]
MNVLYKNGYTFNDKGERENLSLHINTETGKIEKIFHEEVNVSGFDDVIDVNGMLITPGFVDLHVHLREPGGEKKETIETGTMAAARGGFTTIAAMPNTRPVPDTPEHFRDIHQAMKDKGHVRVLPYASITERQLGKTLTDMKTLTDLGAFAFTDDGVGVQEAGKMYEAMVLAAKVNKAIVAHCEDNSLLYGGAVHEGEFSKEHGVPGILSAAESVHIARDVLLAEAAGAHYHVCHVSTKESVRVIRDAKRAGIKVTAEVTPHHLILCEDDIPSKDTNYKMNPPLRSKQDKEALIEGLLDGTIDFIATDHAPHTAEEKALAIEEAPFGIVGLEIAFPLLYTKLVKTGICQLHELIQWLTEKPADAFNLPYGRLQEGNVADFTIINVDLTDKVNVDQFLSKGKNTPFANEVLTAWPIQTVVSGKTAWKNEEVTS